MDTVKTCPACHQENTQDASNCAFCGAPLMTLLPARTTEPVPDLPLQVKPPDHIVQLTKLYSDILVLVVLGQEQPILIKGDGSTTLGRYSPGDLAPAVDLTPFNANLLGVSRQHATISRSENVYVIEDKGSTNGTWLNEVKLTPNKPAVLKSGDLIRLGQLGLYVYFDVRGEEKDADTELILQQGNLGNNTFTIQDMSIQLIPYLSAVAAIQKLCDSLAERSSVDASIASFAFDSETTHLKINILGVADSLLLLKTKIAPWFIAHLNPMKQAARIAAGEISSSTVPEATSADTNGTNQPINDSNRELEQAIRQFSRELLNEIAPDRSETNKQEMVQQLVFHLQVIATNPLQLVPNR